MKKFTANDNAISLGQGVNSVNLSVHNTALSATSSTTPTPDRHVDAECFTSRSIKELHENFDSSLNVKGLQGVSGIKADFSYIENKYQYDLYTGVALTCIESVQTLDAGYTLNQTARGIIGAHKSSDFTSHKDLLNQLAITTAVAQQSQATIQALSAAQTQAAQATQTALTTQSTLADHYTAAYKPIADAESAISTQLAQVIQANNTLTNDERDQQKYESKYADAVNADKAASTVDTKKAVADAEKAVNDQKAKVKASEKASQDAKDILDQLKAKKTEVEEQIKPTLKLLKAQRKAAAATLKKALKNQKKLAAQFDKATDQVSQAEQDLSEKEAKTIKLESSNTEDSIDKFVSIYGDAFVDSIIYGRWAFIVIQFHLQTADQQTKVGLQLNGINGGVSNGVSVDANITNQLTQTMSNLDYTVHIQTGGIDQPTIGILNSESDLSKLLSGFTIDHQATPAARMGWTSLPYFAAALNEAKASTSASTAATSATTQPATGATATITATVTASNPPSAPAASTTATPAAAASTTTSGSAASQLPTPQYVNEDSQYIKNLRIFDARTQAARDVNSKLIKIKNYLEAHLSALDLQEIDHLLLKALAKQEASQPRPAEDRGYVVQEQQRENRELPNNKGKDDVLVRARAEEDGEDRSEHLADDDQEGIPLEQIPHAQAMVPVPLANELFIPMLEGEVDLNEPFDNFSVENHIRAINASNINKALIPLCNSIFLLKAYITLTEQMQNVLANNLTKRSVIKLVAEGLNLLLENHIHPLSQLLDYMFLHHDLIWLPIKRVVDTQITHETHKKGEYSFDLKLPQQTDALKLIVKKDPINGSTEPGVALRLKQHILVPTYSIGSHRFGKNNQQPFGASTVNGTYKMKYQQLGEDFEEVITLPVTETMDHLYLKKAKADPNHLYSAKLYSHTTFFKPKSRELPHHVEIGFQQEEPPRLAEEVEEGVEAGVIHH